MKHFKLFGVLFVLLVVASFVYAQRESSAASQPQQGSTNAATASGRYSAPASPMWGGDEGNQTGNPAPSYGPMSPGTTNGWSSPGQYGGMGSGMMGGGWSNGGQYGPMGSGMMGGWSNGGQFGGMGGGMMR
jgi:hypothetical protein